MKNINSAIIMLVFGSSSLFAGNPKELKLASPDGTHEVAFYQKQTSPIVNELCYRVTFKGKPVINESRAGLELDNRIWEMALGARDIKQPACWMDNLEFAATMTNNEGSMETVELSFLDKDKNYLACIYTDGGDKVKTKTQVKCTYLLVNNTQTLKFQLKPSGGAAVHIVPVDAKEMKKYKKYRGQIL